ncbi:MAG: radical SAM protein [Candidatus Helarchaeota archaeon]
MDDFRARYKDFRQIDLKVAFCYPNIYQAGIACYGFQLVHALFDKFENILCERFFYSPDGQSFSKESGHPLSKFDILCISLQYELDYVNLLKMLRSAGIPLISHTRSSPLLIAGGPCALENPLPLSPFIDIFVLGDLEPISEVFISSLVQYTKGTKSLEDFLEIPGLYIPRLQKDEPIQKLITKDLDRSPHLIRQWISDKSPFGRSFLLEVARGCSRGCRFCLIGYQAAPPRFRSLPSLKQIILDGIEECQVSKITLLGSSLSDYPYLKELCEFIGEQDLQVSLPSMRLETLSDPLLEIIHTLGVRTITFAPEAGSERLRHVIGKDLSDTQLLDGIHRLFNAKIPNLKMYFLINLPTETEKDLDAITDLLTTIIHKYYSPKHLHLSINPFIPKPHTPFQWAPVLRLPQLQDSMKRVEKAIKRLKIYDSKYQDPRWARIQSLLSRGTTEMATVLTEVVEQGGTLGAWRRVLKTNKFNIQQVFPFKPNFETPLPWDFIDVGIRKRHLLKLYHQSLAVLNN